MNENINTYLIILEIIKELENKNLKDILSNYKNEKEAAKIISISYGIARNYYAIEFIVRKLVKKNNYELELILKIGIFEILFTEKPEYAIINDLVNLAKFKYNNSLSTNFINAVLRSFQKNKEELLNIIDSEYLLKYNLPKWFLAKLKIQYKNEYLPIIKSFMFHPSFGLRINNKKISLENYLKELENSKIEYKLIDDKLLLNKPINVNQIPMFKDGFVSVQDIAAQYLINILNKNSIMFTNVLDACSAPGGKTCQILENYNCQLTSIDIDEKRLEKVTENLNRLNLSAKVLLANASIKKWWNNIPYDLIIADVPCSATGTIKRNPDIKINHLESDIEKFMYIQRNIITNLWDMIKPGGHLLYITCSIFKEENQYNIDWFKNNLIDFNPIDELQILPSEYNDGLYYCLIKKINK